MSISSAPAASDARISASLVSNGCLASREAGRHSCHRDARAGQRVDRRLDQVVIDAHRADGDRQILRTQHFEHVVADRLTSLGAQAPHRAGRVVALQRGQVDAGDRAQQPGRLPGFLDAAPRRQGGRASLGGAAIGEPRFVHPIEVERHAGVARQRARQRGVAVHWRHRRDAHARAGHRPRIPTIGRRIAPNFHPGSVEPNRAPHTYV